MHKTGIRKATVRPGLESRAPDVTRNGSRLSHSLVSLVLSVSLRCETLTLADSASFLSTLKRDGQQSD